jgi:serine/threonine protein kinase
MTATTLPDELLAGYRLVRRLGSGARSQVYLGRGRDRTVALKVFASDVSRESVGAELDALGRHESPHLVRLLDIASDAEGTPILVLERLTQGSVATLLAERDDLECGEAVTILAPLAALVGELAAAGVAHGRLSTGSVHLGAEGQPVVLGLGHCELFERDGTMAALDVQPGAVADREALAKWPSPSSDVCETRALRE